MDERLHAILEDYLDLVAIFDCRRHADSKAWVLHDVIQHVTVPGGITLGERNVFSFQELFITARPSFALAHVLGNFTWFMRSVFMLRFASVAMHSRWEVGDDGFDRVRQNELACTTPTVNVIARL